ncbi:SCP-2 sterol transfer family protein [Tropicimonas sp. IMCC6043]|uniref:SCP-2 sterol transfer family protein n=1 Tax=Tropicimonas sp. IMCC6043 TaxID=2510645 RepID=UPI001F5DAE82|nr:SCP-2 sterol transfer family protein [Tropicimonas sp. IMCC6043]
MVDFGNAWNDEPELGDALAKIGFNSVIGYGFDGDTQPLGYVDVQGGYVTSAGAYDGQAVNWDLRASPADWEKWCSKGIGMMALGLAYTSGKLKFKTGDYGAMIKNPAMAGPFIKSFTVMGRVPRS